MTTSELLAAVKSEGGFDVTDAQALAWINQSYREAVAESRWRMTEYALGSTVAGTASYALPAEVVDLADVAVGGTPYERSDTRTIWRLNNDGRYSAEAEGYFAADYSSTGGQLVVLWPTPSASGLAISGLAALEPTALDTAIVTASILPADLERPILIDGPIAVGKERIDEDLQGAQAFRQSFTEGKQALARRLNSRVGSGPVQMAVRGHHF